MSIRSNFGYVTIIIAVAIFSFYMGRYVERYSETWRTDISFPLKLLSATQKPKAYTKEGLTLRCNNSWIHHVLSSVITAYRHSRSIKTMHELNYTFRMLYGKLQEYYGERHNATLLNMRRNPTITASVDVCPEVYMGRKHGAPYYLVGTGYVVTNCTVKTKLNSLFTVLLSMKEMTVEQMRELTKRILRIHKGVHIVIGGRKPISQKGLNYVRVGPKSTDGKMWNELAKLVKTKYAFIGRDLIDFEENAQIERLIRMVSYLGIAVAGGGHRNRSGHYQIACYQTAMRNYDYRIVEGYDLSYNSCLYCDYMSGPFIARTTLLKQHRFSENLTGEFVFLDAFETWRKLNHTTMVCPDATFFTERLSGLASYKDKAWIPFMKKWDLDIIRPPIRPTQRHMPCNLLGKHCRKRTGMTVQPCCTKELSDMMKFVFQLLDKHGVRAEIFHGTVSGALKLNAILPWEIDADSHYDAAKHAVIVSLRKKLSEAGYRLEYKGAAVNCPKYSNMTNSHCGAFYVRSWTWFQELWGMMAMGIDRHRDKGIKNATKIRVDDYWYPASESPAVYARSYFGDDTFAHIENWRRLRLAPWARFTAGSVGSFAKCPEPGHHACLDLLLPFGNLQFLDNWV